MMAGTDKNQKVIYVVTTQNMRMINYRVRILMGLKPYVNRFVLVSRGIEYHDNENIVVRPDLNLTGILRYLKLSKIKAILDKILFFPSIHMLYAKAAHRTLKKHIENDSNQGKKVYLITVVPHHDLCLLGLMLKREFPAIYWTIEWCDLWSYDEHYFRSIPKLYKKRLLSLEQEILANSDMNVTTNNYAKKVMEEYYHVPSSKVVSISHHYNPDDFDSSSSDIRNEINKNNTNTIKIGVLGNFFKSKKVPGEKVVEAVRDIRQSGINVELHIHGDISKYGRRFSQQPHDGIVFHRRTSHKESLRNIANSDLLLVLLGDLPNSQAVVPQKLAHYLLIGKPILAIVPEPSAVADIIKETGSGYVVSINSNWRDGLVNVLGDYAANRNIPKRNEDAINAYSFENVLEQWIQLINSDSEPIKGVFASKAIVHL